MQVVIILFVYAFTPAHRVTHTRLAHTQPSAQFRQSVSYLSDSQVAFGTQETHPVALETRMGIHTAPYFYKKTKRVLQAAYRLPEAPAVSSIGVIIGL